MARIKWFNGNQGIYRYENLRDFVYDGASPSSGPLPGGLAARGTFHAVLRDGIDYDRTRTPYQVDLDYEGLETWERPSGPQEGVATSIDGTITRITFRDAEGDKLVQISDIELDAPAFWRMQSDGVGELYDWIVDGGSTFVGSKDGSGPDSDWTGDDIGTGAGNDKVRAGGGDDYIKDAGGRDVYRGGGGRDTVSYDQWYWNPVGMEGGIDADLRKKSVIGPDGARDKLVSIENLRGTQLDDRIRGDRKDNDLMGLQGDDLLDGKGGFDVVEYRRDADYGGSSGIEANLSEGYAVDGFGTRDRLRSIEGVVGTDEADLLTGNGKDNYFRGGQGDDTYRLKGGGDFVDAAGGADTLVFLGQFGNDRVAGFDAGSDRVRIAGADRFSDLTLGTDGDGNDYAEWDGNRVTFEGYGDLGADDFLF